MVYTGISINSFKDIFQTAPYWIVKLSGYCINSFKDIFQTNVTIGTGTDSSFCINSFKDIFQTIEFSASNGTLL